MIAANEQVATLLDERGVPALYRVHERPEPTAVERLVDAARVARRADAAAARSTSTLAAGRRRWSAEMLASRRRSTCAAPGTAGAALTSLVLRSLKQAHYTPRNLGHAGLQLDALLPLHLADPPLSRPGLPPRAAERDRRRRGAAASARASRRPGAWTSRARARRDGDRARRRRRRALLPARARARSRRGWSDACSTARSWACIGAGAFVPSATATRACCRSAACAATGGSSTSRARSCTATRSGGAIRLGDPVAVRVERVDAPRGRVDLEPVDVASR